MNISARVDALLAQFTPLADTDDVASVVLRWHDAERAAEAVS